jgi:hypothetical protein
VDQKKPPQPKVITRTAEGITKDSGAEGMLKHMFSVGPQIAAEFNRQNLNEDPSNPQVNPAVVPAQPEANGQVFDGRPITARVQRPVVQPFPQQPAPQMHPSPTDTSNHPHPMELLPPGHDGLSAHSRVYRHGESATPQQMNPQYAATAMANNPHLAAQAPAPAASARNGRMVNSNTPDPVRFPGQLNLAPNYAPNAESTLADSDPRYIELPSPPSRCLFYDWTRLSIRKLSVAEVRKAFQAAQTESFRHFAQILASTLDRPYLGLTIFDFWWCMYYHQQNSYPQAPATVNYTCNHQKHKDMVKMGKATKESLQQKAQVRRQEFEEINISEESNQLAGDLMASTKDELGVILYPPTVMDAIEMTEDKELMEERTMLNHLSEAVKNNPSDIQSAMELQKSRAEYQDYLWINEMASWLHPVHGHSIADRREFLESGQVDIEIFDRIEKFQKLVQHGIVERIITTCQVCAGENVIPVTLSPAHFLPELQRAKFV